MIKTWWRMTLRGPDFVLRQILSLSEWFWSHENWLEKLRLGKNEFVFDQKIMKFGFKTDLGWTWGVNSPTFEGPTYVWDRNGRNIHFLKFD